MGTLNVAIVTFLKQVFLSLSTCLCIILVLFLFCYYLFHQSPPYTHFKPPITIFQTLTHISTPLNFEVLDVSTILGFAHTHLTNSSLVPLFVSLSGILQLKVLSTLAIGSVSSCKWQTYLFFKIEESKFPVIRPKKDGGSF